MKNVEKKTGAEEEIASEEEKEFTPLDPKSSGFQTGDEKNVSPLLDKSPAYEGRDLTGFTPPIIDTQHPKLRAHFENYEGGVEFVNGEPTFDEVREEIAAYYGVPNDEDHMFIIDNKMVARMRHYRAFCVLRREVNGKMEAWYIDGRLPHATMLRRFYKKNYKKSEDDKKDDEFDELEGNKYEKFLGFLDDEGFPDIPDIQKRASEEKREIRWFVKYTVSPS